MFLVKTESKSIQKHLRFLSGARPEEVSQKTGRKSKLKLKPY